MKRNFVLRVISVVMSISIIFSLIAFDSFAAETDDTPSASWSDKIDPILLNEMDSSTEKIPVCIWIRDIDSKTIEEEVFNRTGLTEDNLSTIYEDFSDELSAKLSDYDNLDETARSEVDRDLRSYMERTEEARSMESERTDLYISTLLSVEDEMYPEHNRRIFDSLGIADEDILSFENQGPFFNCLLSKDDIIRIAKSSEVTDIFYDNDDFKDTPQGNSINEVVTASEISRVRSEISSLNGSGVTIGVIDEKCVQANSEIPASRITYASSNPTYDAHATNCARIAAGTYGVAPSAHIYSSAAGATFSAFKSTVANFYNNNIRVVNYSMGKDRKGDDYTENEKYIDFAVTKKKLLFVIPTGNAHACANTPSMAFNAVTTGGFYNQGTSSTSDDIMFENSNYYALNTACFKPEIISPMSVIDGFPGTSYAAPFTTGVIALLYQLKPSLKTQPQVVKAILMSSCHRKVTPSSGDPTESMTDGLTAHQGAGAVNPYIAIAIAGSGNYGVKRILENATQTSIRFIQPGYNSAGLNFSIAWTRENASEYDSDVGEEVNLNLQILKGNTNKGTSTKTPSSSEMVYVTSLPNAATEYTAKITRVLNPTANPEMKFAYAFSVSNYHFQNTSWSEYASNIPEGIYLLRNGSSDRYLTNTNGTVAQQGYSSGTSQLWMLRSGKLHSTATEQGKLAVGEETISGNYKKAEINNTGVSVSLIALTQSNGTYYTPTGLYRFITSSYDALGINGQSTNPGALAAWSPSSASDSTQKWYLEHAAYQRGDVNMDGIINSTDYNLVLSYSVGSVTLTSTKIFLADVNNDNVVDSADALMIAQLYT